MSFLYGFMTFCIPHFFWRVIQRENGIQRIGRRSGYHDIIFDDISPSARGRLYCMLSRTTDVLQSHISERERSSSGAIIN